MGTRIVKRRATSKVGNISLAFAHDRKTESEMQKVVIGCYSYLIVFISLLISVLSAELELVLNQ